jgi:hypothetical protein
MQSNSDCRLFSLFLPEVRLLGNGEGEGTHYLACTFFVCVCVCGAGCLVIHFVIGMEPLFRARQKGGWTTNAIETIFVIWLFLYDSRLGPPSTHTLLLPLPSSFLASRPSFCIIVPRHHRLPIDTDQAHHSPIHQCAIIRHTAYSRSHSSGSIRPSVSLCITTSTTTHHCADCRYPQTPLSFATPTRFICHCKHPERRQTL